MTAVIRPSWRASETDDSPPRAFATAANHASAAPIDWVDYEREVQQAMAPFEGRYRLSGFDYRHDDSLQPTTPARFRRPYHVRVSYVEWGEPGRPLIVCLGGVANVARRFDYLGLALSDRFHVVCPDWLGRGASGWLHDVGDYSLATYQAQLSQLLDHLASRPECQAHRADVTVVGSSLGGSVALGHAAQAPSGIARLVLNDMGPVMPAEVRGQRAEVLSRHYVFKTPAELTRRLGASQKNDGPVPGHVRLHNAHALTRWSHEEGGRVYRHDPRAMMAYQSAASQPLDQWWAWESLTCPVLLIHGMQSNVLLPDVVARMRMRADVTVMHVPLTGHTPALADDNHLGCLRDWLAGSTGGDAVVTGDFSSPYGRL